MKYFKLPNGREMLNVKDYFPNLSSKQKKLIWLITMSPDEIHEVTFMRRGYEYLTSKTEEELLEIFRKVILKMESKL